jgi:S1-C subfamily serine protease
LVLEGGRQIITNRHVVENSKSIVVRNGTGHLRKAKVVRVSNDDDLALLEIDSPFPDGAAMPYSEFAEPATGRSAILMGYPMISLFGDEQPALSEGIIAKATGLGDDPGTFQMTTKLNKGNSGGPVFDRKGQLLGIAVGKIDSEGIMKSSGMHVEDINIGIRVGRILRFLGRQATKPVTMPEMNLEDLYQQMLPRAVLIVGQKA